MKWSEKNASIHFTTKILPLNIIFEMSSPWINYSNVWHKFYIFIICSNVSRTTNRSRCRENFTNHNRKWNHSNTIPHINIVNETIAKMMKISEKWKYIHLLTTLVDGRDYRNFLELVNSGHPPNHRNFEYLLAQRKLNQRTEFLSSSLNTIFQFNSTVQLIGKPYTTKFWYLGYVLR